jgi:hypothetical protein
MDVFGPRSQSQFLVFLIRDSTRRDARSNLVAKSENVRAFGSEVHKRPMKKGEPIYVQVRGRKNLREQKKVRKRERQL